MSLLVEARGLSAVGPDGLLFTSVSGTALDGELTVIVGPPEPRRTALLLALSGRFSVTGGSLVTEGERRSTRRVQALLRKRVAVAQALPAIGIDVRLRVGEVLAERRLVCGNRKMSVGSFWDAIELMRMGRPGNDEIVGDLGPVDQLLLSVALGYAQHADAIAVADVDGGFGEEDRRFVRIALGQLAAAGRAVLATSADTGWGTRRIFLDGAQEAIKIDNQRLGHRRTSPIKGGGM
ncbi:hypothetical protein [Streptomyces sp. NRRL F-2664]|uniref:hypothetical protein n=1 Tax=Streptomyces sp. NRRL F-2664 TaxID=1463842 RepID=UPI00131E20B6|nr:hypothetical protein [Streptomyces sp. NRRL F-2664]